MFPGVLLPLITALALAVAVTTLHRRLPPSLASRLVVVASTVIVGAALPTIWIISTGYLGHLAMLGDGFSWCAEAFGIHEPIPTWIGAPSALLSAIGIVRALRVLRLHRRLRHNSPGSVEIAAYGAPFAFTLPGRGGHVVVSQGLIDMLDEQEQSIVLAHERAHARFRHDRYLLIGQLAAAAMPFLQPLCRRLQFSLERWADEEAAAQHGGDRTFVAQTLGKVALNSVTPAALLSFAGLGVAGRVAALLSVPASQPPRVASAGMWLTIGATGLLAAFQLHHLARLITALCPG